MKTILLNLLIICLNVNCDFTSEPKNLIFKSKIGTENLKMEVLIFDLKTDNNNKKLLIQLNRENKTIFSDTLLTEMNEEPIIELREINGDKIDDLAIEYLRPGRGGNVVSMIYLFDRDKLSLNRISNSILFPNLIFDNCLNYVYSYRFYGETVQMDFLEIKNDNLLPKYEIIKKVGKVYLKKLEKGNWIDVGEKTIDSDIILPEILELEPEIKIKNAS